MRIRLRGTQCFICMTATTFSFQEEAFVGKTWRTEEVLEVLDKMNATEGVIVVGIYPNDRISEYTFQGTRTMAVSLSKRSNR